MQSMSAPIISLPMTHAPLSASLRCTVARKHGTAAVYSVYLVWMLAAVISTISTVRASSMHSDGYGDCEVTNTANIVIKQKIAFITICIVFIAMVGYGISISIYI